MPGWAAETHTLPGASESLQHRSLSPAWPPSLSKQQLPCWSSFGTPHSPRSFLPPGTRLCLMALLSGVLFSYSSGSVQFSCSVVSDSLPPHEPQHARPSCQLKWLLATYSSKRCFSTWKSKSCPLLLLSHQVMSNSLRPHGLQHTRPLCPSPSSEFAQTHVHWVGDAIRSSYPLSPSSSPLSLSHILSWCPDF